MNIQAAVSYIVHHYGEHDYLVEVVFFLHSLNSRSLHGLVILTLSVIIGTIVIVGKIKVKV